MNLANVTSLTLLLVPKAIMREFQSDLNRCTKMPCIRIHPAALKGIKFASDHLRCIDKEEIFGLYGDSFQIDKTLISKAQIAGSWKVEPWRLQSARSSTFRSGLMDSSLELIMEFQPS